MNGTAPQTDVTLSTKTIHNPAESRHFMRLKPVAARVQVHTGDTLLVDSTSALRVLEVGKDMYDPVLYFPRADVAAQLVSVPDKETYCPLKGHATYFTIATSGASVAAWTYARTKPFAAELEGLIAFYPAGLTFTEHMPAT